MTTDDYPPQLALQQLIQGFLVTQCIYVAAKLGIAVGEPAQRAPTTITSYMVSLLSLALS